MKTGDNWTAVATGAVAARDLLRTRALPDLDQLVKTAPDDGIRTLALRIRDAAYAAVGKLTLGLKGRL